MVNLNECKKVYTISSYPTGEEEVEFYVVNSDRDTLADIMKWRGERDLEDDDALEVREWTMDEILHSEDPCHYFISKEHLKEDDVKLTPFKGFQVGGDYSFAWMKTTSELWHEWYFREKEEEEVELPF